MGSASSKLTYTQLPMLVKHTSCASDPVNTICVCRPESLPLVSGFLNLDTKSLFSVNFMRPSAVTETAHSVTARLTSSRRTYIFSAS